MSFQIESGDYKYKYQQYASPIACQAIRHLQGFGGPLYLAGIPDQGYVSISAISQRFEPFLVGSGFQPTHFQNDYFYRSLCRRLVEAGILEQRWVRIAGHKTYEFAKLPGIVQQATTAIAGSMLLCERTTTHSLSFAFSSGLDTLKNRVTLLAFLADHEGTNFSQKTLATTFGFNEGQTRVLLEALARAKAISYDAIAYNSGRRPLIFYPTDNPRFHSRLPAYEHDPGLAREMAAFISTLQAVGITRPKVYQALWTSRPKYCDPKVFGARISNILRYWVRQGVLREQNDFAGAQDLSGAEIADDGLQIFYYLLSPLKDIYEENLPTLQQLTKEVQQRVLPPDKLKTLVTHSLSKYRPHSKIYKMEDAESTPEIVYVALCKWLSDHPGEESCQTYPLEMLLIELGNPLSDQTIRQALHGQADAGRVTVIKERGINHYQPVGYKPTTDSTQDEPSSDIQKLL